MAEFERSLVSERTRAGMAAANARGSRIGRKPAMTEEQLIDARSALSSGKNNIAGIAANHHIHPRTLIRLLKSDRTGRLERG